MEALRKPDHKNAKGTQPDYATIQNSGRQNRNCVQCFRVENNNQAKRVPMGVILNVHFLKLSALCTRSNPHFLGWFDVNSQLGHACN